MKSTPSRRTGALLVCVLVCMGIAVSISLTAIQSSLRERRQILHELQMEQTRWLADAGLRYGIDQFRRDMSYEGQEWNVEPMLSDRCSAKVRITVQAIDDVANSLQLTATATLTSNDLRQFETRHTVHWTERQRMARETNDSKNDSP